MAKKILFIQGAGQGAYQVDEELVRSLQHLLGTEYPITYPKMPEEGDAGYEEWKTGIIKELAALQDSVILVGHSAGSSILLKYLSEEVVNIPVSGVFLIATPYFGEEGWMVEGFSISTPLVVQLSGKFPVFFYHCRDDEVVPFAHLTLYARQIPRATIRRIESGGHQLHNALEQVAMDIKGL